MRFERLVAISFGGLAKGSPMSFRPGMNVVYGPNEAGKSTWHAALFAALCGQRRGRGRSAASMFEGYRPWSGGGWDVAAQLTLEDGRRVEIRQDLEMKIDCKAVDLVLANDVSHQIMNDGAPDGARWLGLDRDTFRAVASVEQADILSVQKSAHALQQHMQRAAAAPGSDATAAAALLALDNFRAENVGGENAPTKPLRKGRARVGEQRAKLESARQRHREYLGKVEEAEKCEEHDRNIAAQLSRVRSRIALADAEAIETRIAEIREIHEKYGDTEPPKELQDAALAREVDAALIAWGQLPELSPPGVPDQAELAEALMALPDTGLGDDEISQTVIDAEQARSAASGALQEHRRAEPPAPTQAPSIGLQPGELRNLASELELCEPPVDAAGDERLAAAQQAVEAARQPGRVARVLLALAGSSGLAAIALTVAGQIATGIAMGMAAGLFTVWWVLRTKRSDLAGALEALRGAEAAIGDDRWRREDVSRRKASALAALAAAGLEPEPSNLREAATRIEASLAAASDRKSWEERLTHLRHALEVEERGLAAAVGERGEVVTGAVPAAELFTWYQDRCSTRSKRAKLEAQADARATYDAAIATRADSEASLHALASQLNFGAESPADAVSKLQSWLAAHREEAAQLVERRAKWGSLGGLLNGRSLAELAEEAAQRRAEAVSLAGDGDPLGADAQWLRARAAALEVESQAARTDAASTRRDVELAAAALISPSAAEEELTAAEAELARVEALGRTLASTIEFLRAAQERVHRDLAPRLTEAVTHWLPRVTQGRYVAAIVNPGNLAVQVRSSTGQLRDASSLSHGTEEQVYLLLRLALARLLVRAGEVAPLILDDITVQSDRTRSVALLETLLAVSAENQVILFTQEDDVRDWARRELTGERDQILELGPELLPA